MVSIRFAKAQQVLESCSTIFLRILNEPKTFLKYLRILDKPVSTSESLRENSKNPEESYIIFDKSQ